MPTVRKSLTEAKKIYNFWLREFEEFRPQVDELKDWIQWCVDDLLQFCDVEICFGYLERCLHAVGVDDTQGGAYWYLKGHYKYQNKSLPHTLSTHWVKDHFALYCDPTKTKERLYLELEHVRDIAKWRELFYVGSESRALHRTILKDLIVVV